MLDKCLKKQGKQAKSIPMPPLRVGTLDVLGLAVYMRSNGSFFFNKEGNRVSVHGKMLWTAFADNVKMRGSSPIANQPTPVYDFSEDSSEESEDLNRERDELEMAISASLQDISGSIQENVPAVLQVVPPAESTRSMCVVCLAESVDHMIRSCNHACVCGTCAPRLHSCPICRERITSVERIWIA